MRELTELADKVAKVQFERRPGVGEVLIVGGQERAISVWLDANRLAAYGIPVSAVRDALVRQNADLPGGNVTTDVQERVLRTMGRVQTPADFANIVITNRGGVPLRISDVGRVEDGTKEQRSLARLNGKPTVIMEVRRQSGANTVAVIDGVKEVMPRVQAQLPADVKLDVIRDQSRLHLQRAARDQHPPRARQHPGVPGRDAVHAQLALDDHRRRSRFRPR